MSILGPGSLYFPGASVLLDNFNRANEGPPMTGWTDFPVGGGSGLKVVTNQATAAVAGQNGAYWNTSMTGPDQEAYVTVATLPADTGSTVLYARSNPAGGGVVGNNYAVRHTYLAASSDLWFISRHDASVSTTLGSFTGPDLAAGDGVGIRCIGTVIQAWARISGVWILVGTANDATYNGMGNQNKLALAHQETAAPIIRWDDFTGGTIAPISLIESLLIYDRPSAWWGLDTADPLTDDAALGTNSILGYRLAAQGSPANAASLHTRGDNGAPGSRDFNGTTGAYTTADEVTTTADGPPALHGSTSQQQTTSNTGSVGLPTGVQVGDLMLFIATHPTAGATVTTAPSGWTLVGTALNCTTHTKVVYRRTADSSDTVQSEYSIVWNSGADINTVILVVRGCDPGVANLVFDSGETVTSSGTIHLGTSESWPEQAWQVVIATLDVSTTPTPNPDTGMLVWHTSANGTLQTKVAAYPKVTAGSGAQHFTTPDATNLGLTTITFGSPKKVLKSMRNLTYPLTIGFLVNGDSFAAANRTIVCKNNVLNVDVTTAGVLRYQYLSGGVQRTQTGPTLSTGTTYRVWIRDDGTNVTFYVNGTATTVARVNNSAIDVNAGNFAIAAASIAGVLSNWFDGRIDEVAIFEAALTDQQILAHETAATLGTFGQYLTNDQTGRYPRAKLEMAITGNPTDVSFSFTDVTPYARSAFGISTAVGRNSELDRFDAGQMSFALDNLDRAFDNLEPARVVRFRAQAVTDGVVSGIFWGYTDGPKHRRPGFGFDSVVEIQATDVFKSLAVDKVRDTLVRSTEYAHERIGALLDEIPGMRYVLAEGHHLIVGSDLQGIGRLEHIQQVAESDGGRVYASAEGFLFFEDSTYRTVNVRSKSAGISYGWPGTSASLPLTSFEPEVDESRLFTAAMVTPSSGTIQTAVSATASDKYFERTRELTTIHARDIDALGMAHHWVNVYSQPVERVPNLRIQPVTHSSPTTAWSYALAHRISDRIVTIEDPPGGAEVSREHFIEGIAHYISADQWVVELQLSPVELEGDNFIIGESLIGGTDTIGW